MNHVFHPDAAVEFEESVKFYQSRGQTLGDRFAAQVRKSIQQVLETPERWRIVEDEVRRCRVAIFPYADFVLIIAIAHNKREPGYWKKRFAFKTGKMIPFSNEKARKEKSRFAAP